MEPSNTIQILSHPTVVEKHNLLELRQDRLAVEGYLNMIRTAEQALMKIEDKYINAYFRRNEETTHV